MPMDTSPRQRSPFLDLPPEIRNIIYDLAILNPSSQPNHLTISLPPYPSISPPGFPTSITGTTTTTPGSCANIARNDLTPWAPPPLSRVSRQLRTETLPLHFLHPCQIFHLQSPSFSALTPVFGSLLSKLAMTLDLDQAGTVGAEAEMIGMGPEMIEMRPEMIGMGPEMIEMRPEMIGIRQEMEPSVTGMRPEMDLETRSESRFGMKFGTRSRTRSGTRSGIKMGRLMLELESHYPLRLSDLVAFVSVWAEYAGILPDDKDIQIECFRGLETRRRRSMMVMEGWGEGGGGGGLDWDENGLIEKRRGEFCRFIRDLITLGRSLWIDEAREGKEAELEKSGGGKREEEERGGTYERYENAVRDFMFEGEEEDFRRFVIWSAVEGLSDVWDERGNTGDG